MNRDDRTNPASAAVELTPAAHRVAMLAAQDADMPVDRWIALAIMRTAADQAGVTDGAEQPVAGPVPADDGADSLTNTLRRLEAKLDALAARPGGARPHLD